MEKNCKKGSFGYDLEFLSKTDKPIVLTSNEDKGAQIIVSAKYQGKVFTSTANGLEGDSLGFINYKVFEAGEINEQINGYGGENRLWLGPEGGQFSIFFEAGAEQVFANWHTPKAIDIEAWAVDEQLESHVAMSKQMQVTNYKGHELKIGIDRKVQMMNRSDIAQELGLNLSPKIKTVGYRTDNKIENRNDFEWTAETGTVCVWMLDMFNCSDSAVTVVPYREGNDNELGPVATTDYFGEIPSDRLWTDGGVMYLKTDGKFRSKIGMNAQRTKSIAGNFDPISGRLTVVLFESDPAATYLNQEWNTERNPLVGDAFNAYNDGPLEDGSILGPFLELESSSPGAFLKPGQWLTHKHTVIHFVGSGSELSEICEKLLM